MATFPVNPVRRPYFPAPLLLILAVLLLSLSVHAQGERGMIKGQPALAYWTIGGGGETVVVLHGGPGAASDYLRPEWDFLSANQKVIYYDQRGAGKSERANCYSWQAHVEDLQRVIQQISPNKPVVIAGSSWGVHLALPYASRFPTDVKALILSGTVAWRGEGATPLACSDYYAMALALPNQDTGMVYVSVKDRSVVKARDLDSGTLQKINREKYFEAPFLSRVATLYSLKSAPLLSVLQTVKIPALIFEGKGTCADSKYLTDAAQSFAKVLPNSKVVTLNNACHDPWFTHPKEFFQVCDHFLKELTTPH